MIIPSRLYPLSLLAGVATMIPANAATLVFSESFDGVTAPAAPTTANTGFSGVLPGDGSIGSIVSTVGDGSSAIFNGSSSSGSGAYVVKGGLAAMNVMSMGFTVRMESTVSGTLGIFAGNGNTVGNNPTNTGRNTSHMLWDIKIHTDGSIRYLPTGSNTWTTFSDFTVQDGVSYEFLIQVNNSAAAVDGVAANSMSIYANGSLIGSGLSLRSGVSTVNGFRIGAREAENPDDLIAEIDDIRVWDGIQQIPEPSTTALLLGGTGLLARRRRG
ncbi:PEP-CTERM sorting domain-containing protein [Luteolibacter sp. SL250]|uniref:PEP-CTERM sorting domain-containing protein n=1 Tax=Luteolibacter sp. SL250 TaxID=2995170 RepID=UPI0022704C5C|nr:PEP-CTERM sorting domain-containing protein [Luteolibacter sp. SL250]WAC20482.1 PEP-CTERM sorting domain-containing protein [Luteolibacter sp. SL250]